MTKRLTALLALGFTLVAPVADAQLQIAGSTSTLELAPVLLAAQELGAARAVVRNGGIPALFEADAADLATNAEAQALRQRSIIRSCGAGDPDPDRALCYFAGFSAAATASA